MKLTPCTATLKDGASVRIREVTPQDRALLQLGYARLSEQSRFFRFLAVRHDLTTAELDVFTAANSPDHVAIGALLGPEGAAEPIGLARYVRLEDRGQVAEIALTIVDGHQRRGLGSLLLGVLAACARRDGITEFSALVHGENRAMLELLRRLGGVRSRLGGTEIDVSLPLPGPSGPLLRSSAGDAFRTGRGLAVVA